MRQPSRSIMPGWVWANGQVGEARIDTGKVWTLTGYAYLRGSLATAPQCTNPKWRSPKALRVYGFL